MLRRLASALALTCIAACGGPADVPTDAAAPSEPDASPDASPDAFIDASADPTLPGPDHDPTDPTRADEDPAPAILPVIAIDTEGDRIEHDDKVAATLYVVEDHDGTLRGIETRPRTFEGAIGIAIRGNSSAGNPKHSFSVETRTAAGEEAEVSLLGLPAESDWVLYAPYNDKSLVRDKLAYDLGRDLGRYAPRSRFVEVTVDGEYQGVYVLLEKIKRGKDRVAIPKAAAKASAGDLTGGYIIKREDGGETDADGNRTGWQSASGVEWDYHEPKATKVSAEQRAYLTTYVDAFERAMEPGDDFGSATTGYPRWIDVPSFVDYVILTELSRNVDGYRKSTYLYKDRDADGGRLHAGPIWDYNLAFGNADYCGGERIDGFQHERDPEARGCSDELGVAPWWGALMADPAFASAVRCRWESLRAGLLSDDALRARIDAYIPRLTTPEVRDNDVWQTLGTWVWPNPIVFDTYAEEIAYLRDWVTRRAAWLDTSLPGACN